MRKNMKNIILVLLVLTLSVSTGLLGYLYFFSSEDRELSGKWAADMDMTEQAAAAAFGWLQEIEAVSVALEDMESCMQGLTVQVHLTLEQTARSGGRFQCNVLPESYNACSQAAYEAFAEAFRELLAQRLRMAGYTGSTDKEAVEALVTETFGMSTVSYLMTCGPALLPSLEDLQTWYDGSGTYEISEGILFRQFDDGQYEASKTESYIRKGSLLILLEETGSDASGPYSGFYPVIYTLKQSEN